jgi:hypothetical protein
MEQDLLRTAGIVLITVPAVEFGGLSLLKFLGGREPGYVDNPLRQGLFRAGHAHAGVLVIFALVGLLYLDRAGMSDAMRRLVSLCLVAPPILMPLGFFLSVTSPQAERPNRLIWLTVAGAAFLAAAALSLGIALVTS